MFETIIKIEKSPRKDKKYKATVKHNITGKIRTLHFGAHAYGNYKDSTKLKIYSKYNHLDKKRRERYFLRHSGVKTKKEAIKKETIKSKGLYTAKILSHIYLW